jgi:peptide/nickel transport system substrate-binding protein
MCGRSVLALLAGAAGMVLLVVSMAVRPAHSASGYRAHSVVRGGTLRLNESLVDFDYVDPQLAYRTDDALMLNTTAMLLVGYPEKAGPEGMKLAPIGAAAFPTVSADGKTYTFRIRQGMKFSDGSAVTAAAYQRAFERTLSPEMGSPVGVDIRLQDEIVGGEAFLSGKSQHIAGVSANGLTLTIRLTKPNAVFLPQMGMEWFTATKPNTPYASQGLNVFPSAGPYYIAARDPGRSTVLRRNPYYRGSRPANPDRIVFTPDTDPNKTLLQTKSGEVDMDLHGVPPTAAADLARTYGVDKGRFFVGPTTCVEYMSMNGSRPPFNSVRLRRAANWAIDRPAQVRLVGAYGGRRTDQILVPGVPGYRPFDLYSLKGADVAKAKQVGGAALAAGPAVNFVHTATEFSIERAQIAEYDLRRAGFRVKDVAIPAQAFSQVVGARDSTYDFTSNGGWCADYFDPYDYLNVPFDGRTIRDRDNSFYTYWNNPAWNAHLDHAASLSGAARVAAYAKLDHELMAMYAPVVPYLIDNARYFVSSRVHNWIFSRYFGGPYLNALSVR